MQKFQFWQEIRATKNRVNSKNCWELSSNFEKYGFSDISLPKADDNLVQFSSASTIQNVKAETWNEGPREHGVQAYNVIGFNTHS